MPKDAFHDLMELEARVRYFFQNDLDELIDEILEGMNLKAPYSDDGEAQDMEGYESGGEGGS